MLSIFLFVVIFSIYIWLFYEPPTPTDAGQPDKDQSIVQFIDNRTPIPEQPASIAATEQLTTKTESATESVPEVIPPSPKEPELVEAARESAQEKDAQAGEDAPIQPSELEPEADAEIEPTLTEEEAIALAVETTLAADATLEASAGDREGSVPELIRPHPPDPELVEVAIRDAEEKAEDFSPPESVNT
jgi:hypothetical protein